MILFRRTRVETPAVPTYSFCEHVNATPTSPEHLRTVGDEGQKFGGGVPGNALCGRDLRFGWDLATPVTDESVRALSSPRSGDGRVFLCRTCAAIYLTTTSTTDPA